MIVVGGGLAGLVAAVRCAEAGLKVTLLEARRSAGGRTRSMIHRQTGEEVDTGQHLFVGAFRETLAFLERIGSRQLLRPAPPRYTLIDGNGRSHALTLLRLPAPLHLLPSLLALDHLPWSARLGLGRVALALKTASRTERAAWDWEDAASWLARHGQSEAARSGFWDPMILATLNERPARVSAAALAVVLQRSFFAGREAAEPLVAAVGLSRLIAEPAVSHLGAHGAEVRTGVPVCSVEREGKHVRAVRDRSGKTWRADRFVLALPPDALLRLAPDLVPGAPEGWTASPILTVHLWLDRPLMNEAFVGLLEGPVHWVFNPGFFNGKPGGAGHRISLVTSAAGEAMGRSSESLVEQGRAALARVLPASRKARIRHALVLKERRATTPPRPGFGARRPAARTMIRNLWLAGDWTATGLPPTMESAAISGRLAAEEVLHA